MKYDVKYGVYHGPQTKLLGKRALLRERASPNSPVIYAQFDDMRTGFGLGWHVFKRQEFTPYPETVWD